MKNLPRFALTLGATALFAGCGALRQAQDDMQPPIVAPAPSAQTWRAGGIAHHSRTALSYQVLHRFGGLRNVDPDRGGFAPEANVIDVAGTLYGTTAAGGTSDVGTVFSVSTTGEKKTLYNFRGGSDGAFPIGGLIDVDGTLYGTTGYGGGSTCNYGLGCGTVYSVTTAGVETVLYPFLGGSDGAHPASSLIDVNGTLYGTTEEGGGSGCSFSQDHGCGTVYSVTTSGQEAVVHSFQGADGAHPDAGLIAVKGTLYGTTLESSHCGTVFKVTTSGSEKVLHDFSCYSDGASPTSPLIDVKGTLYSTTLGGGSSNHGIVFSMSTTGSEKVLHNFAGGSDGAAPFAGLVYLNGKFYGTTYSGGSSACPSISYGSGCGTIYGVDASGSEKVVYPFQGGSDGAQPFAGLVGMNGTLYGTTAYGGGPRCKGKGLRANGCGTVFALSP
jgi:uncharacterized repeat protein (TIGR03803 family)